MTRLGESGPRAVFRSGAPRVGARDAGAHRHTFDARRLGLSFGDHGSDLLARRSNSRAASPNLRAPRSDLRVASPNLRARGPDLGLTK